MELYFGMFNSLRPPHFIQKAHIRAIKPTYNTEVFGILWNIDLSILLDIVKRNGESYSYTLNIRCNYQKDQSGNIIGWSSAFKISKLFNVTGVEGKMNIDGTIPEGILESVIGKEIFVLSYITGLREDQSVKYQMWDVVESDKQSLLKEFELSMLKGYPKNYSPEVLTTHAKPLIVRSDIGPSNNRNPGSVDFDDGLNDDSDDLGSLLC